MTLHSERKRHGEPDKYAFLVQTQYHLYYGRSDALPDALSARLGINDANDFVQQFMPKLYEHIWSRGVKFSNYYTAASDCTAARATIHTGLYAYQTYSMLTLTTYKAKGDPGPQRAIHTSPNDQSYTSDETQHIK